jgi:hypothetical protein
MAFTLGVLAVSMALLFVLDDTWFQLLHAIYLALVCVQISLLAHDFGHRQFSFRAPLKNDWPMLVFPFRSACRVSRDPPYQSGVSQCTIMSLFILLIILLYFS